MYTIFLTDDCTILKEGKKIKENVTIQEIKEFLKDKTYFRALNFSPEATIIDYGSWSTYLLIKPSCIKELFKVGD